MKQFKNILISVFSGLLFMTACQEDEVIPYGDFTDIAIFSPKDGGVTVQVEGRASFADGSRGTSSRMWSVPSPSYFINNEESELTEEIAHIQFMEVGKIPVTLHLEFPDSTLNTDSVMMVTVLDSITTDIEVLEVVGNYEMNGDKYILEAGSIISMTDTSSGSPDTYEWILEGFEGQSFTSKTVQAQYKKLGTYDVTLVSSRVTPYGRPDTLHLADFIEVVPSSLPVVVTSVNETAEGVIQLQFSRELDPLGDELSNFSVMVNDAPATITSVRLNANDPSILEVTTEEELLNSQTATISYNADNGAVKSSDYVDVDTFENLPVTIYALNLFTLNNDFESGEIFPFGAPYIENAAAGGAGSHEIISGGAISGDNSLYISMEEKSKMSFALIDGFFPIEKDKVYAFEFWVKINESPKFEMTVRFMPSDSWSDGYKQWMGDCCTPQLKSENHGEWQKVTILTDKVAPADWELTKIHFQLFSGAGGQSNLQIDNMRFFEYEVGPTE